VERKPQPKVSKLITLLSRFECLESREIFKLLDLAITYSKKILLDDAYQPEESEELEEGDEDAEEDWEIGAFAWGLITAGGLGAGSAGVFGAEVMAR